ncbi:MAG: hypothetical protein HYZ71_11040 [Deltaproteobacteria bacterium]|nr:hypothetical protein [Deltaproteobacteria bacterium]
MIKTLLVLVSLAFPGEFTAYDVTISTVSRDNYLEGALDGSISVKNPYTMLGPKPFFYSADVKVDGGNAFVVAGTNPTARIRQIRSLTGVSFQSLEGRMAGLSGQRGVATANAVWAGISNIGMRRSNDGFLKAGETLRSRMAADNDFVLSQKITHQKVALPLLVAIQAHEKSQADGDFEYEGKRYTIKTGKMGDPMVLQLLKKNDPRRMDHSGWIGYGMQGSPFNDEVFANWYFEITPSGGGPGIRGDSLTAQLIYRYGFYQGGKYRMDPAKIIQLFDIRS